MSIALIKLGRKEEAMVSYNKTIEIDPNDAETYYNMGNILS